MSYTKQDIEELQEELKNDKFNEIHLLDPNDFPDYLSDYTDLNPDLDYEDE